MTFGKNIISLEMTFYDISNEMYTTNEMTFASSIYIWEEFQKQEQIIAGYELWLL